MSDRLALEYIDYICSSIDQAGVNAGLFSKNTKAHLANSLSLIRPSEEAENLAETVLLLAGKLEAARARMHGDEAAATENLLLENISRLREAIEKCPPSDKARNLGV